jgi:DNA modification methylase
MCPTQKPIEIVARPIRYHTKPGELIFEPFSGSGTAFVGVARTASSALPPRPLR